MFVILYQGDKQGEPRAPFTVYEAKDRKAADDVFRKTVSLMLMTCEHVLNIKHLVHHGKCWDYVWTSHNDETRWAVWMDTDPKWAEPENWVPPGKWIQDKKFQLQSEHLVDADFNPDTEMWCVEDLC